MALYGVFRKGLFGNDTDFCEENELNYFDSFNEANKVADELTECYADDDWYGHKYHRSKFYAKEISEEYLRSRQQSWVNMKVANMMM